MDVTKTKLFKFLKSNDESLAARVTNVRSELSKWLPKVAQFFPHYPSHGLDHSDRIIEQLSRLLFNKAKPVVKFSSAEVYCLLCAAYLHDMGMVISPGDSAEILQSDEWKKFVGDGGKGQELYGNYLAIREKSVDGNKDLTDFLADQQLRYVIADFVRRDHHIRGKATLELHPFLRQLVDDGDCIAFETIGDLGVGHGLQDREIADDSRFPEERDVFDGKVNVRFLARLLRIGDLLDMSSQRADPMTARAVNPLPPDANPHWQQYSAKKHENITPNVIEFTFECKDQDAHRVLRDWFGWLEGEVRAVELEQVHSVRHNNWKAPRCIVDSRATTDAHGTKIKPTIIIKPAPKAKYAFHDWRLELDQDLVLQRLICDVYENTFVFIRELIQNALDATRCQMYADLARSHTTTSQPDRPTRFPPEVRERYPVLISIANESVSLSPDGPTEERPVFTIEDHGTGMDEEIIRRYFLQVGRSYYQSNEFREQYKFAPTSRFGVGFLSVFAVSSDITVETGRRNDASGKIAGLRLRLREPRNYILTEPWSPFQSREIDSRTGTRIRVVLNSWPKEQSLTEIVRHWCVAVEVPIVVKEANCEAIIHSKRFVDGTILGPGGPSSQARFILRTFEIDSGGVEGQIAVIAYDDGGGEGWCDCWSKEKDLDGTRLVNLPKYERGFVALQGVRLGGAPVRAGESYLDPQWIQLCDVRSATVTVSLARSEQNDFGSWESSQRFRRGPGTATNVMNVATSAVEITARIAIEGHLTNSPRAKGSRGVYYMGSVLSGAPVSDVWRDQIPGLVVTWQKGRRVDLSVAELLALPEIVAIACLTSQNNAQTNELQTSDTDATPKISLSDVPDFAKDRVIRKIFSMNLTEVRSERDLWFLRFSTTEANPEYSRSCGESHSWVVPVSLPNQSLRCKFLEVGVHELCILDKESPLVQWARLLRETSKGSPDVLNPGHVEALWRTMSNAPWEMYELLRQWRDSPAIPDHLKPPLDHFRYSIYGELRSKFTLPADPN